MLVITRKKNESIAIGSDITLTVVDIRGDKVRLGVACPKETPVLRQEIFDAIHSQVPPRSLDERPFLQAITEEPDDEGARLVFADWLEERGDPLGEFLRNHCVLVKLARHDRRRRELKGRQRALWAEHGWPWLVSLPAALWSGLTLPPA